MVEPEYAPAIVATKEAIRSVSAGALRCSGTFLLSQKMWYANKPAPYVDSVDSAQA